MVNTTLNFTYRVQLFRGVLTKKNYFEILGVRIGVAEVSVLPEYEAASLRSWFRTFRDKAVVQKCREPITQWRGIISLGGYEYSHTIDAMQSSHTDSVSR
jgi:hypothetical protein